MAILGPGDLWSSVERRERREEREREERERGEREKREYSNFINTEAENKQISEMRIIPKTEWAGIIIFIFDPLEYLCYDNIGKKFINSNNVENDKEPVIESGNCKPLLL
jgi:hypothetical protein